MSGFRNGLTALLALAIFSGAMGSAAAKPKGLAQFKGKYSGAIIIAQGAETRVVGTATLKVTSDKSGKNGKIIVSGSINSTTFKPQVFTLKKGRASVNIVLPGFENFSVSATGKFKASGKRVQMTLESDGTQGWTENVTLVFEPNGSMVSLSGTVNVGNDTAPVYFLATGA